MGGCIAKDQNIAGRGHILHVTYESRASQGCIFYGRWQSCIAVYNPVWSCMAMYSFSQLCVCSVLHSTRLYACEVQHIITCIGDIIIVSIICAFILPVTGHFPINDFLLFLAPLFLLDYFLIYFQFCKIVGGGALAPPSMRSLYMYYSQYAYYRNYTHQQLRLLHVLPLLYHGLQHHAETMVGCIYGIVT